MISLLHWHSFRSGISDSTLIRRRQIFSSSGKNRSISICIHQQFPPSQCADPYQTSHHIWVPSTCKWKSGVRSQFMIKCAFCKRSAVKIHARTSLRSPWKEHCSILRQNLVNISQANGNWALRRLLGIHIVRWRRCRYWAGSLLMNILTQAQNAHLMSLFHGVMSSHTSNMLYLAALYSVWSQIWAIKVKYRL